MQIRTVALALIALSAAVLTSCVENDRTMGDNLVPEEYVLEVKTKSFDLAVTNQISDSVQSVSYSHILVGDLHHPLFGTVTSSGASFIVPYSDSTDLGDSPKLVEAYLNLSIDSSFYTDPSQEGIHQRIHIYELLKPIDSTFSFNTSMTPDKYSSETVTKSETVIYGPGTVKIQLKDSFAEKLLATTPEEFEDMDLFMDRIYGLYITSDPISNTTSESGRLNFINLGSSTIQVEYIMNDPDRDIVDLDTTESFAFAYYYAFNYFQTSSNHFENDNPEESLYIESLSGAKPHIDAKQLKRMLDEWIIEDTLEDAAIILSRAELVFPYELPGDGDYEVLDNEFPSMIYAFTNQRGITTSDSDTSLYYEPLEEVSYVNNIGSIDRSLKEYSMDITQYVQDLLQMDSTEINSGYDLWISPMYSSVDSYSNTYYYFDNQSYCKAILNGPKAERKPVLNLTFGIMRH